MITVFSSKNGLIFLGLLLIVSCQSLVKNPKPSDLSSSQLIKMDQALIHVKEEDFLKAVSIYDKLSKELRGNPAETMMLFNSASNYRSLGICDNSVIRYRRMLERSSRQLPLKARGLLEISYSYACLGDLKTSFLSLGDAGDLRTYLPREISEMIYPARLSISYAWLGQKIAADKYKSIALTGVLQSKKLFRTQEEVSKHMSRIFYFMGRSYMSKKNIQADAFVQSFSYHQVYLFQSLFLNNKKWSLKSKQEIVSLFDKLHFVLLSSDKKTKKKYKKSIESSFREGQKMIRLEKSSHLESFYKKQRNKIKPLLN